MLEPTKITINGRNYTVNPFSPIEAYEFYHDRLKAYRNGESLFLFGMRAIGQCLDEMLNELSDKKNFTNCFSKNPEDMIALQNEATEALLGPFLPKETATSGKEQSS